MLYENSVTLLDLQGGPPGGAPVSARWWMLWTTTSDNGSVNNQQEDGLAEFTLSTSDTPAVQFSFPNITDYGPPYEYGLSLQDSDRVGEDTGWLFRSGRVPDPVDMPTDPIEVIADQQTFVDADIAGLYPMLPFQAAPGVTVTEITGTLGTASGTTPGGYDFTATGTADVSGLNLSFTYSGRMVLTPSSDVTIASTAVTVGVANPSLVFTAGPSVSSEIEAIIANAMIFFIMRQWGDTIVSSLQNQVNASIVAAVGKTLTDGVLPAGIMLSVRTIAVNDTGNGIDLEVRGALGAFGGVLSKLPVLASGCPLTTLMSLGLVVGGLPLLRSIRDHQLAATGSGRWLAGAYYRHGPEISALLTSNRPLAASAGAAASEIASALHSHSSLPPSLRLRCKALASEIAAAASPELRAAIVVALALSDRWPA